MRWAPREKATAAVVKARNTSMITVVPTAAAAPLVKLAKLISMSFLRLDQTLAKGAD